MGDTAAEGRRIRYCEEIDSQSFQLVELPDELVQREIWANGICLKGEGGEEQAVLCTRKRTYELTFLESSNTGLLVRRRLDEDCDELQAVSDLAGVVQLHPCPPRLDQLSKLLEEFTYDGMDDGDDSRGYSFDELSEKVQASDGEILDGLQQLDAIKLRNRWLSVEPGVVEQTLGLIGGAMLLKEWSATKLNREVVLDAMKEEVCPALLGYCLDRFFRSTSGDSNARGLEPDPQKLCTFYAERLLQTGGGMMLHEDFFAAWQTAIPEEFCVTADKSMLRGTVVDDKDLQNQMIVRLSCEKFLPSDLSRRMNALFDIKATWSRDELEPYFLADLDRAIALSAKMSMTLAPNGSTIAQYRRKNQSLAN